MATIDNTQRLSEGADDAPVPSSESPKIASIRKKLKSAVVSIIEREGQIFVVDKYGREIEVLMDKDEIQIDDAHAPMQPVSAQFKNLRNISDREYFRTREYIAFDLKRFARARDIPCNPAHMKYKGSIKGDEAVEVHGAEITCRLNAPIYGGDYLLRAGKALDIIPLGKSTITKSEAMETLRLLKLIANEPPDEVNITHGFTGKVSKLPEKLEDTAELPTESQDRDTSAVNSSGAGTLPVPKNTLQKKKSAEVTRRTPEPVETAQSGNYDEKLRLQQIIDDVIARAEHARENFSIGDDIKELRKTFEEIQGICSSLEGMRKRARQLGVLVDEPRIEFLKNTMKELNRRLKSAVRQRRDEESAQRQREALDPFLQQLNQQAHHIEGLNRLINETREESAQRVARMQDEMRRRNAPPIDVRGTHPSAPQSVSKKDVPKIWSSSVRTVQYADHLKGLLTNHPADSGYGTLVRRLLRMRNVDTANPGGSKTNPAAASSATPPQTEESKKADQGDKTAKKADEPKKEPKK